MNTLTEFFSMGGYGLYVWGSFGVTALLMLTEPLLLLKRRETALKRLRRIARQQAVEAEQ